jgi:NAD(P)-dependent dehydrogenase (short-subunit alcohol dehydrogenase family)
MHKLKDRVAIITGGAQGIGAAYARAMAAEGASVAIADILDGSAVVTDIQAGGGRAMAVQVNVADEASVLAMAEAVHEHFGRIDILVNNAAVYASLQLKPFSGIDVAEWDKVMAVNVRGPFVCAKAVVPFMRSKGYGRIVNISSGTPFKGTPNLLHYVTSKGAILALTRALAREVGGDGICVNTLAPGLVLSEGVIQNADLREKLTGPVIASRAIKRDQTPADLIEPLLFLASDACAFMTGETMVVDGGSVMH